LENPEKFYDVTFETSVYGGESLGRLPDGRAVFVPFVLPGEQARIRLVEEKPRHARGEVVELLVVSPERIAPRCKHFTRCGGCHYQHVPYALETTIKTAILRDQLERIGHLANPEIRPMVVSPNVWNYRNTVQFHLDPEGKLGFVAQRAAEVLPIEECHLPEESLNKLWPQFDLEPVPGLERIGLRLGVDEDILVTLESQLPDVPDFSVNFDLSAVYLGPEQSVLLSGSDHTLMEVLGREFRVSAGSFFQVNTPVAEKMVAFVLENALLTPQSVVLDVYCGVGLFSAFLAERAGQVVGVEFSPYACYDFEINLDEFDNVALYEGEARGILPHLVIQPDLVLVDPPRAGIERQVLEAILHLSPQQLIYVSCDPATLARDARRLVEGGYRLKHITPFDLFPHTFHIESISLWEK
jgi:23S rRNA (uracil1939-C5)-methyltransferase